MALQMLFAAFAVGLLGSVHCLGMCGGLVAAFSLGHKSRAAMAAPPPHAPISRRMSPFAAGSGASLLRHLGRLSTYALGGALAGALGSAAALLDRVLPVQVVFYALAQLMLVGLGLYVLGYTRHLAVFERAGGAVLRAPPLRAMMCSTQAALARGFAGNSAPAAYAAGLAWGLMPCAMVYAMLATALVAGDGLRGAGVMLAFGLGTVPLLLASGTLLEALQRIRRGSLVRIAAGGAVIAFGLAGLARAGGIEDFVIDAIVCHNSGQ